MDELIVELIAFMIVCWMTVEFYFLLPRRIATTESVSSIGHAELESLKRRYAAVMKARWLMMALPLLALINIVMRIEKLFANS